MNKKIFRSTLLVALLVLLASVVLIFGILIGFFENQIQTELKSEIDYISHTVQVEGNSFFESFDSSSKRVTLISPDGTVLADTNHNPEDMDNHLSREEVKDALSNGEGKSVRYSDTRTEKTIYYATKLPDGNILRVSTKQVTAFTMLLGLLQPIIFVFAFAVVLSLILSYRVSASIVKPINSIDLDNPVPNEAYEELSPLLRKISAQKRTIEHRIREAKRHQEEFRLITENMSEGFLAIDERGVVLICNKAALRLLGIEFSEGQNVFLLNISKELRYVTKIALDGKHAESEMALDERTYNLIANPVFDGDKTIGAIILIPDITETHKREQLRREFTSNVSHELKTPLTSISGFAEIMKSGTTDESTVVDFSTVIYDEAQRLIALVSDIIKLSELDEGSINLVPETIDLLDLAKEEASRLIPGAEKANIDISVNGDNAKIHGVRKVIGEMLYNLLDNAIKYGKSGGYAKVEIKESISGVSVSVKDNGIGIPVSEQPRIFERFYRVDKSHSKEVGGTGLGLSIVKHGAIYHNAKIDVESMPDVGTTITITFNKQ
ncbi:MAG: PAS domain-containing protein [Oscillospiraceae bacterium]|nr:PAS domain-containing protein [Oscillospiraceae bacterium]